MRCWHHQIDRTVVVKAEQHDDIISRSDPYHARLISTSTSLKERADGELAEKASEGEEASALGPTHHEPDLGRRKHLRPIDEELLDGVRVQENALLARRTGGRFGVASSSLRASESHCQDSQGLKLPETPREKKFLNLVEIFFRSFSLVTEVLVTLVTAVSLRLSPCRISGETLGGSV